MSKLEQRSTPSEESGNRRLFYDAIRKVLLRPEAQKEGGDSLYVRGNIPESDTFAEATFVLDDFMSYQVLLTPRPFTFPARSALLRDGRSVLSAAMRMTDTKEDLAYATALPDELDPEGTVLKEAMKDGLVPVQQELFVWDAKKKLIVPDPFEDPHLLALYRHLSSAGQTGQV